MKSVYFLLPVLGVIVSCVNNGNSTSNSSVSTSSTGIPNKKHEVLNYKNSNKSIYTMGGTYDSMSNHPTNVATCLNAGNNLDNIEIKNPHAALSLDSASSSYSVSDALGSEITVTAGWGGFSHSATYKFARTTYDDNYSLNFNYVYQYVGDVVFKKSTKIFGNDALTNDAKKALLEDPVGFRKTCGDQFIKGLNAGLSLAMNIKLTFKSHAEKNVFDDSMQQAKGLSSILSQIRDNTSGIGYDLTISGIQAGGDPNLLTQLFAKYGGGLGKDGYPILQCGNLGANSSCVDLIDQVMDYAKSVSSQLKSTNDYYLYNPTIGNWNEIDIYPKAVDVDPNVLTAMEDLTRQYDKDLSTIDFLNPYYNMLKTYNLLSPEMDTNLSQLIQKYNWILDIYNDPSNNIMNCYDGFISTQCVQIRDHILQKRSDILNNADLNNLLIYLENNQYHVLLLNQTPKGTGYGQKILCDLNPITPSGLNLYLVNCDGQVSGTLDQGTGIRLDIDQHDNLLHINNLDYSYQISKSDPSSLLHINYLTGSLVKSHHEDTSWSGTSSVTINGSSVGKTELSIAQWHM